MPGSAKFSALLLWIIAHPDSAVADNSYLSQDLLVSRMIGNMLNAR
jgi:hypothetical protein